MSFDTQPRELRQQIQFETFDTRQQLPVSDKWTMRARVDDMDRWAAVLRMAGVQLDDIDFVSKQWRGQLVHLFHTQCTMLVRRKFELLESCWKVWLNCCQLMMSGSTRWIP